MSNPKNPVTPTIRQLKAEAVSFLLHPYTYEKNGGTATASVALGVAEHGVIKTLVMETDSGNPFIVLMHGDRQVSAKALARQLGVKTVQPCTPQQAEKITGYSVGGISPFGTRLPLPVYMEASIAQLPEIYINAGKRGLLLSINPQDLIRILHPVLVAAAI
ncbi:MAG: Cys-tRNA(Pro) deacylase [Desulfatirhabdiaceae bacterium]|nr:Cys-tRNA(Pro) deacylase [Desulfatirhabdiaceae bacterium]